MLISKKRYEELAADAAEAADWRATASAIFPGYDHEQVPTASTPDSLMRRVRMLNERIREHNAAVEVSKPQPAKPMVVLQKQEGRRAR